MPRKIERRHGRDLTPEEAAIHREAVRKHAESLRASNMIPLDFQHPTKSRRVSVELVLRPYYPKGVRHERVASVLVMSWSKGRLRRLKPGIPEEKVLIDAAVKEFNRTHHPYKR